MNEQPMKQMENKEQNNLLKYNQINNHIKYKYLNTISKSQRLSG